MELPLEGSVTKQEDEEDSTTALGLLASYESDPAIEEEEEERGELSWVTKPKNPRSKEAHLKRKEKRAMRRWQNQRDQCSPEKQDERVKRQRLQLQQKQAARAREQPAAVAKEQPATVAKEQPAAVAKEQPAAAALQDIGEFFMPQHYDEGSSSDDEGDHIEGLLPHQTFNLQVVHNEDHMNLVWKNEVAMPPGCGTFLDAFDPKSASHHVEKAPTNTVTIATRTTEAGKLKEIYACEGEGGQAAGLDIKEMFSHVQQLPDVAATNMATNEYRGVKGYGFVGGVGNRFLYTAEKGTRGYYQDKIGPWACKRGKESQRRNILNWVQKGGNAIVSRVEKWGDQYRRELKNQRKLMDLICRHRGSACFTFPSAQVGINGGYGTHKDKRDCRRTVWLCTGTGALVFPQYEHILWLHPGDIVVFDGEAEWHANMVSPMAEQRRQIIERVVNGLPAAPSCPDEWIPQLDGDHDFGADSSPEARAQARQGLRDQGLPNFLVQQIVCYYFQKQQRSYFVNDHNSRQLPGDEVDPADFEPGCSAHTDSGTAAVDPGHEQQQLLAEFIPTLSAYELARLQRIRENEAEIARLGISRTSTLLR